MVTKITITTRSYQAETKIVEIKHFSSSSTLQMIIYADSQERLSKISAHADGGPRSRVCARETLRSAPHRREQKFSGAQVYRVTVKH